ncbi:MAG: signal peptidase II [Deltaproteobacteria bacterium]|nr:signal peptidase II [Deltaproteobacteria bacterium]
MVPVKQRITTLVLIAAVIVLLDQATKYLVVHYLTQRVVIIPGFLDLVSVYNRGVAFGMFNNGQCIFRTTLLTVLSVAVFFVLFFVYLFSKDMTRLSMVALSLIMGGAVGNVIDRIRLGYVVDFIDMFVKNTHWPAFNVADSAITVGAVLLAIDLLFPGNTKKQS